jgi:phage gpG-like protein
METALMTLTQFAAAIVAMVAKAEEETNRALEAAARLVEKEAKAEISTYQNAAGPFAAWEPLAQTTLDGWGGHPGKIALGYAPPDNPLLREGDLRASIHHTVGAREAVIGSESMIAVYQELGTNKIPPRSFLGGAMVRKTPEVLALCGKGAVRALMVASTQRIRIP